MGQEALIKIIVPGVPDVYQGTELRDLSLVDPDSRRTVDCGIRMDMLAELKRREQELLLQELIRDLVSGKDNGMMKNFGSFVKKLKES